MTLAEYGTSPWLFEPTDPAESGHKTKEIKMSSEDATSQKKISETVSLMRKEAKNEKGETKVGKSGRVVTIERNPSVPSKGGRK